MKGANSYSPKKAPGLFDQLKEALGISTRRNNLVVNLTQTPCKAKPINDTKFSVPKKYAVKQADLLFQIVLRLSSFICLLRADYTILKVLGHLFRSSFVSFSIPYYVYGTKQKFRAPLYSAVNVPN